MNWLKNQISKEVWSPYVAGILLGIVGILAVVLSNSSWALLVPLKTWPG